MALSHSPRQTLRYGVSALLPYHIAHYVWPAVAIAGGASALFGPVYWDRAVPSDRYDEPADWM